MKKLIAAISTCLLGLPCASAPFEPDASSFYRIRNEGASRMLDIADGGVCVWTRSDSRLSQQWRIVPQGDYWKFINRDSGLAVADAASWNGGYTPGSRLVLEFPDAVSDLQLWSVQPLDYNVYAVVNKATGLCWTNEGGRNNDGNPVISWTSDANNSIKPTRQWSFATADPDDSGIAAVETEPGYEIGWSPSLRTIFFRSADPLPEGTVSLSDLSGKVLGIWKLASEISVRRLPSGTYILTWETGRERQSVKIII